MSIPFVGPATKFSIVGTHLRTPALKTGDFSKKSVVLVKRKNGFTKTLHSLFSSVSCPEDGFLVSPFLRFTKTTDFFTKIPGLRAGVPERLLKLGTLSLCFW